MKCLVNSLLALLVLAALVAAGCTKPEDRLVGHYDGKATIPDVVKKSLGVTHPEQLPIMKALEAGTYTLDLKQDKTYSSTMRIMGRDLTNTGTWTVEDNQITLRNSQAPDSTNPTVITASEDGRNRLA